MGEYWDMELLHSSYPWVKWHEPVPITVQRVLHDDYKQITRWCCRICIANHGMRGDQLEVVGFLTEKEAKQHIDTEH